MEFDNTDGEFVKELIEKYREDPAAFTLEEKALLLALATDRHMKMQAERDAELEKLRSFATLRLKAANDMLDKYERQEDVGGNVWDVFHGFVNPDLCNLLQRFGMLDLSGEYYDAVGRIYRLSKERGELY